MHVLNYLSDPRRGQKAENSLFAEYRLLSSGTLYRDAGGDYTKSEVARMLLSDPLLLFVVSRPFDNYPAELALQLTVPQVVEEGDAWGCPSTDIYHPDDEVAKDLAVLLSVLCRRLISVSGKTAERITGYEHVLFERQPVPMPLATGMRKAFWRPHPYIVMTSMEGQRLKDYNPPPKSVDAKRLTELLLGLPRLPHSQSLVASCRLYALALELIHERPDVAYQLLISSVETIANGTLRSFQPPDDAKVEHQKSVYELALTLGLGEEAAKKLAIEACKREWWATRKFKRFLLDNVAESVWTEPDELFRQLHPEPLPKREAFERVLGKIYNARSKATHEGQAFPDSAAYTGGPMISVRAGAMLYGSDSPFPPVIWFERIVNSALCTSWDRSVPRS